MLTKISHNLGNIFRIIAAPNWNFFICTPRLHLFVLFYFYLYFFFCLQCVTGIFARSLFGWLTSRIVDPYTHTDRQHIDIANLNYLRILISSCIRVSGALATLEAVGCPLSWFTFFPFSIPFPFSRWLTTCHLCFFIFSLPTPAHLVTIIKE